MKILILVVCLMGFTGCETMKRHPVLTGVVVTSLALSLSKYGGGGGGRTEPEVMIPREPGREESR
jgi:hypothetical protein